MSHTIRFGTDGWRGVIAEDYTFANVRRATQGYASYMIRHGKAGATFVIGHDKRFHSENFALAAAEVMAGNGLKVLLTDGATPTPVIAFSVVHHKAAGAINITASHNPPTDNGFKVRNEFGGAIDPEGLKEIESLIPEDESEVKRMPASEAEAKGLIQRFDPAPAYIEHLKELIDVEPIKQAGLKSWWTACGAMALAGSLVSSPVGKPKLSKFTTNAIPSSRKWKRPEPITTKHQCRVEENG